MHNVTDDVEEGDLRRAVIQIYLPPEAKGKSSPLPTGPLDVYGLASGYIAVMKKVKYFFSSFKTLCTIVMVE